MIGIKINKFVKWIRELNKGEKKQSLYIEETELCK